MDKTFASVVLDPNPRLRRQAGECWKSRHVGLVLDGVIGQRDPDSARLPSASPPPRETDRSLQRVAQRPVLEIHLELLKRDQPGNDETPVEVFKHFDSEHVGVELLACQWPGSKSPDAVLVEKDDELTRRAARIICEPDLLAACPTKND